jgi:hypothetical protein
VYIRKEGKLKINEFQCSNKDRKATAQEYIKRENDKVRAINKIKTLQ